MQLQNGRPTDTTGRPDKEIRTYDFWDKLGIEYQRIDHEAAFTMIQQLKLFCIIHNLLHQFFAFMPHLFTLPFYRKRCVSDRNNYTEQIFVSQYVFFNFPNIFSFIHPQIPFRSFLENPVTQKQSY